MTRFFETKDLIPPENFIEIRYEDFVGNEVDILRQVYSQFQLPDFKAVEGEVTKSVSASKNYKSNRYCIDEKTLEKVTDQWAFSIEKWKASEFKVNREKELAQ